MIFLNKIEHHEYSKATWQKIHIYLKSGQVGPNACYHFFSQKQIIRIFEFFVYK